MIANTPRLTAFASMLLPCIMLAGCINLRSEGTQLTRLPPCSAEGSLFADIPFDEWPEAYHDYTSRVIDAHLEHQDNTSAQPLVCTAEDYDGVAVASPALVAVAGSLPAWSDNDKLAEISEADMATVLIEFLRVYECSLSERREMLGNTIQLEDESITNKGELDEEHERQIEIIEQQQLVARPALERTLKAISGYDRFRPLMADVECIKRSSLDLRNVLGLTAEASACLPRAAGARGSLFDPPDVE